MCEKFLYDESRQAVTRAGVLAAAIRPTETPLGISSHVVASSQFRGRVEDADCLAGVGPEVDARTWVRMSSSGRLRFHKLVGLPAYPHVDTPTAGTSKHDRGVPKMLNPHVDAQTTDVWKHTRTITQMLSRKLKAERCVFPHSDAS